MKKKKKARSANAKSEEGARLNCAIEIPCQLDKCLLIENEMIFVVKYIYLFIFADPRVNSWAMMSSPIPTLVICLSYAYFSKVIGPRIMENRKPFNLRKILVVYNLIQTLFSMWIFYEVG